MRQAVNRTRRHGKTQLRHLTAAMASTIFILGTTATTVASETLPERLGDTFINADTGDQIQYASGLLDTLRYFEAHGLPDQAFLSCIFGHENAVANSSFFVLAARDEIKERDARYEGGYSAAEAMIERLQDECRSGAYKTRFMLE